MDILVEFEVNIECVKGLIILKFWWDIVDVFVSKIVGGFVKKY